jgi:NADPH2:quinone reductase
MQAIVFSEYGEASVLTLRTLPEPQPGAGQVSIRVAYASVNYADIMTRRGQYHVAHLPAVPGFEVSGYVHALGAGVTGLRVGQPVSALTQGGGYAELALAPAALTIALDGFGKEIELTQAAAFLVVSVTAYHLLADVARIQAGETVLIHAAAGGVGSMAVQIARQLGAGQIIGTVGSQEKVASAQSLGYDRVVVRANFVQEVQQITESRGVDIILDAAGEPTRSQSLSLLAPLGRLVVFGNASAQPDVPLLPSDLLATNKAVLGYSFSGLMRTVPQAIAATARQALALLANGHIDMNTVRILPLEQAAEAHRLIEAGSTTGKLLLQAEGLMRGG